MTRDDIIRMALEAGFSEPNPHDGYMGLAYDYRDGTDTGASLKRFANLVAATEREACAKVCENPDLLMNSTFQGVAEAIRARGRNIK